MRAAIIPAIVLALALIGTSAPVLATTITYTGQVYGGGDNSGELSGTVDGPFTGQYFSLTYALPGNTTQSFSNYPVVTVNLCISGDCSGIGPIFPDTIYSESITLGSQQISLTEGDAAYHAGGLFSIETSGGSGDFVEGLGTLGGAYGYLTIETTVIEGLASPVPEPSTWAMLLIGFTGIGFIACRRKKTMTLRAVHPGAIPS